MRARVLSFSLIEVDGSSIVFDPVPSFEEPYN